MFDPLQRNSSFIIENSQLRGREPLEPALNHLVFVRLDDAGIARSGKIGGAGPAHDAGVASTAAEVGCGAAEGAAEVRLGSLGDGICGGFLHRTSLGPMVDHKSPPRKPRVVRILTQNDSRARSGFR
jgi:hypothetical protein